MGLLYTACHSLRQRKAAARALDLCGDRHRAFAVPFATIPDSAFLFFASATLLAVLFVMYHEPMDLAYAGYMALVGQLVEHVGQSTGQWHYPGQPWGGVPLWLFTLWAGFGLFTRRLILPLLPQPNRFDRMS
jgi:hypothetical protein